MTNNIKRFTRKLLKQEDGATAIEYGLIAALISVVIITAIVFRICWYYGWLT